MTVRSLVALATWRNPGLNWSNGDSRPPGRRLSPSECLFRVPTRPAPEVALDPCSFHCAAEQCVLGIWLDQPVGGRGEVMHELVDVLSLS